MRLLFTLFAIVSITSGIYAIPEVYFSPHDHIKAKILSLIEEEKESIQIAMYLFTDKAVATALCKAKKRGVRVELVVDILSVTTDYAKVPLLHTYDIPIYVYDGGGEDIMHDKFWIFGRSKLDKKRVITGSFNMTARADIANRENVVLLDYPAIVVEYEKEFERLKKISKRYSKKLKRSFSLFDPSISFDEKPVPAT
jgi:phosphatidylserine/phosphatidylglycerophosphate/cardiolipin synthase-like enzyme